MKGICDRVISSLIFVIARRLPLRPSYMASIWHCLYRSYVSVCVCVCDGTDWNLAVYNDLLCEAHFDRIGLEHGFLGSADERRFGRLRGRREREKKREMESRGSEEDRWREREKEKQKQRLHCDLKEGVGKHNLVVV